jgi:DNA primase
MAELGLPAFAKTGDALDWHVIVPVGDAPADATRTFAELVARVAAPGVVKVASSPILAPWSPVAGAGSRVSTPVPWDEVTPMTDPRRLTTRTVAARAKNDPMAPLLVTPVDFGDAVTKLALRLTRA